jgi:hypothetical protein
MSGPNKYVADKSYLLGYKIQYVETVYYCYTAELFSFVKAR